MWSRQRFEDTFSRQIKQLLHVYPIDHRNKETGEPFWSLPKRPPHALTFDFEEEAHMGFIEACSALQGQIYGFEPFSTRAEYKVALSVTT